MRESLDYKQKHATLLPELRGARFQKTEVITPMNSLRLTPRQADVLYFVLQGLSNKAIAKSLGIATNTVRIHLRCVFRSLNVSTRVQAILAAGRLQIAFKRAPASTVLEET